MYEVLGAFNFGSDFIKWIKAFYCKRSSYIIINGFLSDRLSMEHGVFQGCPILPLLFCAIEVLAISIRKNTDIEGIKIGAAEKKVSLLQMILLVF